LGIAPILKIDRQHVGNFDFLYVVPFFAPWPVFGSDVLSEPRFRSCNFARSASCGDMARPASRMSQDAREMNFPLADRRSGRSQSRAPLALGGISSSFLL
jgi:hypothetical protein